jgi:citrate lyase acyl carrier protein
MPIGKGRGGKAMTGRSGKAGTDGKVDAEVEFEEASGGGVEIFIVPAAPEEGSTDGEAIDAASRELLADMEIENCNVKVRDHGAPAWVARARLETAIKRSGVR